MSRQLKTGGATTTSNVRKKVNIIRMKVNLIIIKQLTIVYIKTVVL